MMRRPSQRGRRNPRNGPFSHSQWSLLMFAIGIQGNNQTQCATRWQVTLYLLRGKRQETANALVSVPPISTSSLSALIYSMLSALRVINIWTAITLLSPPSGLSAECLQTATFLKVLGIDSKVFRQRGWSVSSPGGITRHHRPAGVTPNHWFSHLRSWARKKHNLSHHIYEVWGQN